MIGFAEQYRPRRGLCVSILTLIAIGVAGCSSDTSRFNDNPFASRTTSQQSEVTGSIARGPTAPVGRVESRALSAQPLPPPPRTNTAHTGYGTAHTEYGGTAVGAPGLGSYRPPQTRATAEVTGSLPPEREPRRASLQQPTARGTVAVVAPGETLAALSRRYGVSIGAIMQANGISSPNSLRIGQRVIIPSRRAAIAEPPRQPPPRLAAARAPATVPAAPAYGGFHVVGAGDTLSKIARRYRVSVADLARANRIKPYAELKMGERLAIPAHSAAAPRPAAEPRTAQVAPVPPRHEPPRQVAAAVPAPAPVAAPQKANLATPTQKMEEVTHTGSIRESFRWPVHGRIVMAFGPKPNGQRNDGINIAVPEGTPIKAAEAGEVAYAGNELKGYGNLILVRHANGYVTAYAHASQLMVKRGDKVKRGQVIAKAGQTGNVTSPQLHFEIRKGSTPVDPMSFLGA